MLYVGLDIHLRRIAVCVLNETGQVMRRAQVRTPRELTEILEGLPDRFEVCYEASCGYGHFYDILRPPAARVLVAHPGQLRLIYRSKNKNDRQDAERLAKLLYLGEVPTVHVPTVDVRTWRELINYRSQVIAKRTRAKNTIRSPPRHPGLWTKKGIVPHQDQSGDKNRLDHITREGTPVVRRLVAEAAWQAQRRSPTVHAYFERAQRDDPQRKKIALMATAHYLVRVMYALLKHGTLWHETVAA
jgi:transposase